MIIQCDKCKTKFRLDDSRVKGRGVRVKCTKCQTLFIVTPPEPPVELEEIGEENVQTPVEDRDEVSSAPSGDDEHPTAEKEPASGGSDSGGEPTWDSAMAEAGAGEDKEDEEEPTWGDAFGEEKGADKDKGEEPTWDSAMAEAGAGEDKEDEEEPTWGDAFGEEEGADKDKGEEPTWDSAMAEAGAGEDKKDEEEPTWGDAFGEEVVAGQDDSVTGDGGEKPVEAGGDEPASDEADAFTFAADEIGETPAVDRKDDDFDFAPAGNEGAAEPEPQPPREVKSSCCS
jgi:predicted Zn finger-like uncharacterized protein